LNKRHFSAPPRVGHTRHYPISYFPLSQSLPRLPPLSYVTIPPRRRIFCIRRAESRRHFPIRRARTPDFRGIFSEDRLRPRGNFLIRSYYVSDFIARRKIAQPQERRVLHAETCGLHMFTRVTLEAKSLKSSVELCEHIRACSPLLLVRRAGLVPGTFISGPSRAAAQHVTSSRLVLDRRPRVSSRCATNARCSDLSQNCLGDR
jgi:hypothetical protein